MLLKAPGYHLLANSLPEGEDLPMSRSGAQALLLGEPEGRYFIRSLGKFFWMSL